MQSWLSSTFWQLTSWVILPVFEGFEGDVAFRPSPHANLTGSGSRTTAITKMELFEQVTLGLAILKEEDHCIGSLG